ncbi:MAG: tetratricopeptide repeat protein [Thermodesulfobacteriota bacterium]
MNRILLIVSVLSLMLAACQSTGGGDTIAKLRDQHVEIKEEQIEGGLDKALQSYQGFLEKAPDSALAPEAIRRMADLKIEKEYGTITDGAEPVERMETGKAVRSKMTAPAKAASPDSGESAPATQKEQINNHTEDNQLFVERATRMQLPPTAAPSAELKGHIEAVDDLDQTGLIEAIELYQKLLAKYPMYTHNDQVLYQMSRAYAELGRIDESMVVMQQLASEHPQSRYIDEVQFRRAEYFFTRRKYLEAEDAYKSVVDLGEGSSYFEMALYKLGWTFYKQELYEEAQHRFIALLDHKKSDGYDFHHIEDDTERKRLEDTLRVISLGFSNLGGADSVVDYFSSHGKRSYEDSVYSNLAEFYFDKRRYADANATYKAFISRNPFHRRAPNFHMRAIEIHTAGGFPTLVLDDKKAFAKNYGLQAEYWNYFEPGDRQDVLDSLKTNLTDLAHHYHSAYQKPPEKKEKQNYFNEAVHWYRDFMVSFPTEKESPAINYQLADLFLENEDYGLAAAEYEKTAYDYAAHEKSSEAGYAVVYALRKQLETSAPGSEDEVKREVVRTSVKFVDNFPDHEKAAIVLGAAAEDLYAMKDYEQAFLAGTRLVETYPNADETIRLTAWLVSAHSAYELQNYETAELAYIEVLNLLPSDDETRPGLVDNLAASIYKQGEQANAAEDYKAAADHFLRVGRVAPTSTIRANAEYDGAAALIQLEEWDQAAAVLNNFRTSFPEHELQAEVTKKIAYVYKQNGQLLLAAREYERIETESADDDVRRDALQIAADLYTQEDNPVKALEVYRRYVGYFPQPVERNLETRNKIAEILKAENNRQAYLVELDQIVAIDDAAGSNRTPRTRYLAGNAAMVLAEVTYEKFVGVDLVKPFQANLHKKQTLMKKAVKEFNRLMDYEIGDITAGAIFYLAEIYAHFSTALMTSERPEGLTPLELEEYELEIEDQAYPFEEKAIEVHESNLELISRGVYNDWIDRSLQKLARIVPVRYDKPEESSDVVSSLETYIFAFARPTANAPPETTDSIVADQLRPSGPIGGVDPTEVVQNTVKALSDEADGMADTWADQPLPETSAEPGEEANAAVPATVDEADTTADTWADQPLPETSAEPGEEANAAVPATVDEADTTADTWSDQPLPETSAEPGEEANAAVPATVDEADTTADTWSDQPLPETSAEPGEEANAAVPATVDEADTTVDTWADQPLPETNTEPEENIQVIVSDPKVETPTDMSEPSSIGEAAPEIQAAEPVAGNKLVLWVDENAADESDVQESSLEVTIP